MRMMTMSTIPPKKAATRPSETPTTSDTVITDRPMKSEMRAP